MVEYSTVWYSMVEYSILQQSMVEYGRTMATCTESIVSDTNLLLPDGERAGAIALEEDAEEEEEEEPVGRVDGGETVRLALCSGGGPLGRLVVETTLQNKTHTNMAPVQLRV